MNRRPTLIAALTLTAAAALTLSACGSDDSSKDDNDKIAGADTGGDKSASPTASASAAVDRPKIELPADLSYTFDWSKTGDKDKDAVLSDSEQSIKAVDLAIVNQDALDKAYLFYYEERRRPARRNSFRRMSRPKPGSPGITATTTRLST